MRLVFSVADKGGIQLLPETRRRIDIKIPGENRLLYAGLAAMAMIVVLFFGLLTYKNSLESKIEELDKQIVSLNTKRDKKTEESLRALHKQTQLISQLLDNHLFWTQAFGKVEDAFQSQVQLKSLSASGIEREFLLTGIAANYATMARQMASFLAEEGVEDINLHNVKATNTGNVEFTVQLLFNQEKFLLHKK